METQRRFIADAAHELRSPMTALSLQAERLSAIEMSAAAHQRLLPLTQGIERSRKLIDQLLALATAQSSAERSQSSVSVHDIYRRVLEDLLPLAERRHIDIGVESFEDVQVVGNEMDLLILVRNLVDNAIRYTPEGGRVDLTVERAGESVILEVKDSGPGISAEEQLLVFDPFYRSLGTDESGSGLGLAIVKAIADRMGARLRLSFSDEKNKRGLCVSVGLKRAR
jgi:two-component system OmpR family sensor kinase